MTARGEKEEGNGALGLERGQLGAAYSLGARVVGRPIKGERDWWWSCGRTKADVEGGRRGTCWWTSAETKLTWATLSLSGKSFFK